MRGFRPAIGKPSVVLLATCAGPSRTALQGESWGAEVASLSASFPGMTGCERLPFNPSVSVAPDTAKADEPAGYGLEIRVPQDESAEGLATADLREAVELPEGVGINVSAAEELKACSEAESELGSSQPAMCPDASKVGTVVIKSPLIEGAAEKQFEGSVYLLGSDPPNLKLLVAASADGVNLKLVLDADLNESTGRSRS